MLGAEFGPGRQRSDWPAAAGAAGGRCSTPFAEQGPTRVVTRSSRKDTLGEGESAVRETGNQREQEQVSL